MNENLHICYSYILPKGTYSVKQFLLSLGNYLWKFSFGKTYLIRPSEKIAS